LDHGKKETGWKSFLLGIGLDEEDGHYRVTRSEDFQILGGSERTHRRMQEKIIDLEDELARDGRTIASLQPDEYEDVSQRLKND